MDLLAVSTELCGRLKGVLDRLELIALIGIVGEDGDAEDVPAAAGKGSSILEDNCGHASLVDDLITPVQACLPLSRSGAFDRSCSAHESCLEGITKAGCRSAPPSDRQPPGRLF